MKFIVIPNNEGKQHSSYHIVSKAYKTGTGDELYVLARRHKMCNLVNWSRPSNSTSCSCTPDPWSCYRRASQTTEHMWGDEVKHLIILQVPREETA
jgi:hypothetical protein